MEPWGKIAALSVGGILGVNARYWLGVWIDRGSGPHFPWTTFTINVSGAFAIGLIGVLLSRWAPHPHARLLAITGFLGGYTTFSTFAQESVTLWDRHEFGFSLAYMLGSVAAGFVAVVLGAALGRVLAVPSSEWTATRCGRRQPWGPARPRPAPEIPTTGRRSP